MRILIILLCFQGLLFAQQDDTPKTIHVYVALCDNVNQGIVPVSKTLGNGQDPKSNLYWGALYGVKTHFKKSADWVFIKELPPSETKILERVLFKHANSNTYLLAEAYDGAFIKQTTIDFLEATSGRNAICLKENNELLNFGGSANLLAYIGHDGLMEFDLDGKFDSVDSEKRDAIILACISKDFFKPYLEPTGANPLVWTTGLMAPEAYTLKWAIDGWILGESNEAIRERAAQSYHHYQKCGIRGARNLLVTGY